MDGMLPDSLSKYVSLSDPGVKKLYFQIIGVLLQSVLSVQFSRSVVSDSWPPREWQHARSPCPSPTPGVHSDSRPLSQ